MGTRPFAELYHLVRMKGVGREEEVEREEKVFANRRDKKGKTKKPGFEILDGNSITQVPAWYLSQSAEARV